MSLKLEEKTSAELSRLGNVLTTLEEHGVFPVSIGANGEKWDKKKVSDLLQELSEKKFTIAVCGSVKSGKSTFLNSLLFGKEILPTSDVPCTAKLTFISHTEGSPFAEVAFYSNGEYENVKNELSRSESSQAREIFNRQRENSTVSFSEVAGTSKRFNLNANKLFDALEPYVTENGKYTPYVRDVHLYIRRPELKNIDIVDTPGLNDPNPLNSMVTKEWANKAHALIYLFPWRGMDIADKEFIKKYFCGMERAKSNRVFIMTRIDENADWASSIKQFRNDFSEEKIYGYSSKIKLLKARLEAGGSLSEDDNFRLERFEEEGGEEDPDNVAGRISEVLYQNEGKHRIASLQDKLENCCHWCLKTLEKELEETKDKIYTNTSDKEKIQREVEKLTKLAKVLEQKKKDALTEAKNLVAKKKEDIVNESEEISKRQGKKVKEKVEGYSSRTSAMRKCFPMDVQSAMRDCKGGLRKLLQDFATDGETCLNNLKRAADHILDESGCEEFVNLPPYDKIFSQISKNVEEMEIVSVSTDEVYEMTSIWYSRKTNTQQLSSLVDDLFSKQIFKIANTLEKFQGEIISIADQYMNEFTEGIQNSLAVRREAVEADESKREANIREAESRKQNLEERIRKVEGDLVRLKA